MSISQNTIISCPFCNGPGVYDAEVYDDVNCEIIYIFQCCYCDNYFDVPLEVFNLE